MREDNGRAFNRWELIERVKKGASIADALRTMGATRQVYGYWRRSDKEFRDAMISLGYTTQRAVREPKVGNCPHAPIVAEIFAMGLPLTECWEWHTTNRDGYAYFYHERRQYLMHRAMYEYIYGPIPDGHQVDHVKPYCSSRACCNPHHLEAVTAAENQHRRRHDN